MLAYILQVSYRDIFVSLIKESISSPAIGEPSKAPIPWKRRNRPKQLVSRSRPRYSTTTIERNVAKHAEKKQIILST